MSTRTKRVDDGENLNGGDLGDGRGLKPGGIPMTNWLDDDADDGTLSVFESVRPKQKPSDRKSSFGSAVSLDHICEGCEGCENTSLYVIKCSDCRQDSVTERSNIADQHSLTNLSKPMKKLKLVNQSTSGNAVDSKDKDCEVHSRDECSDLGDIALGTSIRQQKLLYEQTRKALFEQGRVLDEPPHSLKPPELPVVKEENGNTSSLSKKLMIAERDIEILRYELETCKRVSESRCKAMRLFKGHSYAVQTQQIDSAEKASRLNKALQAEINQLQFELEYKEASMLTSQEMWTGRFAKVSSENQELKDAVAEQTDAVRKLQAEKTAHLREQDELLALLDIQERQRYEATRSQSPDDSSDYNSFTSMELAVLGACRCRIHNPQPCGCAHAAAYMKREIAKQKGELAVERQRVDEATIMADAYRIAFEEQLNRNSGLMRRLVDLMSVSYGGAQYNVSKPRAALRWLIKQLNEEDYMPVTLKQCQMEQAEGAQNTPQNTPLSTNPPSECSSDEGVSPRNGAPSSEVQTELPTEGNEIDSACKEMPDEQTASGPTKDTGQMVSEESLRRESTSRQSVSMESVKEAASGKSCKHDLLGSLQTKNDDELVCTLLEMINDRTEALAHQRLAARMLAKRLTDVELKLSTFTEDVFHR